MIFLLYFYCFYDFLLDFYCFYDFLLYFYCFYDILLYFYCFYDILLYFYCFYDFMLYFNCFYDFLLYFELFLWFSVIFWTVSDNVVFDIFNIIIPDEGYYRNASCELNSISTFLLTTNSNNAWLPVIISISVHTSWQWNLINKTERLCFLIQNYSTDTKLHV
jgi:hypothetical protein